MAAVKGKKLKDSEDGERYGALLLREEDRITEWTDPETGDVFTIRAKWPKEQRKIGAVMSGIATRMGKDDPDFRMHNLPTIDIARMERDATIQVCLVEGPGWWKDIEHCNDDGQLDRLAQEIDRYTAGLHEELKKNRAAANPGNGRVAD